MGQLLSAPADVGVAPLHLDDGVGRVAGAWLVDDDAAHLHLARQHQGLCLLAALGEAPLEHQLIEP